jgi:hypothetical protein
MPAARLGLGPISLSIHGGADGVGIGLAISGGLIRRLHGRIQSRLRASREAAIVPGGSGDGTAEAAAILAQVATVPEW